MSNMRLGPWDLKRTLWDQMDAIRVQERKTWRFMLTEACRMFIASRGLVPDEGSIGERYAHAPNVERVPNPAPVYTAPTAAGVAAAGVAAAGVAAAGVAAAGVAAAGEPINGSTNEKRLYWLLKSRARTQECLDAAPIELEKDPKSLRALNWLARMPDILEKQDVEIAECEAAIAAEKAAKENSGEVLPGVEV